jgi:hypothetical protein
MWVAALLIMVAAAVWQRVTGPTHPKRGRSLVAGQTVRWRLPRSGTSGEPLLVAVPAPDGVVGTVHYRHFPLDEPFQEIAMTRAGDALAGLLPSQAPAGKLEYFVILRAGSGPIRVPDGEPVVMRFKGEVPLGALVPHVTVMFFSMLIGVRAALAALFGRPEAKRYAWVTVVGITLGGLVLGPIVQKSAFGASWTGWPLGSDLTDNKTAVMWLAWVVAVVVLARRTSPADRIRRATVILAALVMIAVYLVPHSLRGSQLVYGKAKPLGAATEPITTGR